MALEQTKLARAVAKLMTTQLARQGLTYTGIVNQLIAAGQTYRRTEMFADVRAWGGIIIKEAAARAFPVDRLFPISAMVETKIKRARKYKISYEVDLRDPFTWETEKRTLTHWSNNAESKEGWGREIMEFLPESASGIDREILNIEIFGVEHQRGDEY